MNGIVGFCGAAVCFACLGVVLKQLRPDFLPVFVAVSGLAVTAYVLSLLAPVGELVSTLSSFYALPEYFSLLIKAVGISLLCGAAADICRDLGENTLAGGVESGGKAAIILLSLPVVEYLLKAAAELAS